MQQRTKISGWVSWLYGKVVSIPLICISASKRDTFSIIISTNIHKCIQKDELESTDLFIVKPKNCQSYFIQPFTCVFFSHAVVVFVCVFTHVHVELIAWIIHFFMNNKCVVMTATPDSDYLLLWVGTWVTSKIHANFHKATVLTCKWF